jgi:uncharacterized protein
LKKRIIIISPLIMPIVLLAISWIAGGLLSAPANEPIGNIPADLSGASVQIPSQSGGTLQGWYIPGQKGAGAVVLMHGVRANRLSMLDRARFLSRAGYTVLLFDFQAHGESPGQNITFGYLESRDAIAAVEFLRARVTTEKVGVIGVSMGGAAASLAAPHLNTDALVLEMVYPTINDAVSDRLAARFGGWARVFTPLLTWQLKPRLGVSAEALRPLDRVGSIRAPKLFVVGAEDRYTTLAESRQLFDAAAAPKSIWVVDGAGHQDLCSFAGTEYERRILAFFAKYLKS